MFPVWAHTVKCLCPIFSSVWVGPASLHRSVWSECGLLGAPLDILSCDQGAVTDWGMDLSAGHPHQPFLFRLSLSS